MEKRRLFGVTGRPILHSMSPAIFARLFEAAGIEASYLRLGARRAEDALELFRGLDLEGMNVTAPFKEEMAGLLDGLEGAAAELGAVNCVAARRGGGLSGGGLLGRNTDPDGILGPLRARGLRLEGCPCLVIGAGGAGRAAAWALRSAGAAVTVANRTRSRADTLAAALGCASAGLEDLGAIAAVSRIVVSTLRSEHLADPGLWLHSGLVVLDADYRSGILAAAADRAGAVAIGGLEWLVHQALAAWSFFVGGEAPLGAEALAKALASGHEASAPMRRPAGGRSVALVGLMASGKSAVGRELARLLRLPHVDTDREVEREAGKSVARIFTEDGESDFRSREKRALERAALEGPLVLSTGGGAVLDPANRRLLGERFVTVWLHASPETAAGRLKGAARPLLRGGDPTTMLRALAAERREAYAASAALVVSSESARPRQIAEAIHDEIAGIA